MFGGLRYEFIIDETAFSLTSVAYMYVRKAMLPKYKYK